MFKASVLSDKLKTAVSFSYHAVSSRSQLPVLLNFLIEAKEGSLFISATDLEIGIKVKVPAKIDRDGSVCVSAKTFLDLISNVDQEKIDLEEQEKNLILKAEKIKASFPISPTAEFPALYESKGEKQAEFKKKDFDDLIQKIVFASAQDLGRPALSGVLIRKDEEGDLAIVATDGYRLSLKRELSEKTFKGLEEVDFLIPGRIIKEVVGLREEEGLVGLFVSKQNNQILFEYGDMVIVGRLIDVEYPDYKKIIPDDFTTRAVFDKNQAHQAVRACSVFAREAANIVKMSVGKNKIVFSSSASSVGENEVEVEAKTEGEENEIAFNARYLLEFFSGVNEDDIVFEMTGPLNPGVFKLEKDKSYLHLIMPIRVTD